MSSPAPISINVTDSLRVRAVARTAKSFAGEIGFESRDAEEIALVVTELASNLVKHAGHGVLRLAATEGRVGIRVESEDRGPGIADTEQAVTDGFSTAGSLGAGLGTVNRLMDELDFYSCSPSGIRIVCHRWKRPRPAVLGDRRLEFGVATRAYRRGPENGDAFIVRQWDNYALAGVIDGLGHGQFAQRAAQTARRYVELHFDQSLDHIFRGVGRACRATRGVVMALTRFDLDRNLLTIASVGNIETRLIAETGRFNPIIRRGIIGMNAPNPVPCEHPWTPKSLLIIHSDGLQSHWDWKNFQDLIHETPDVIAQRLLAELGKIDDDATVLVARHARS
jgi:anti-sigma regulatory factor (Ser/Thr protein kinase)